MDKSFFTYALIKSLYDRGRDYTDSFWPFVIRALPVGKSANPVQIQRSLRDEYSLDIPQHVLENILKRAIAKEYVAKKRKSYYLTDAGLEYLDTCETEEDVSNRITSLLEDTKTFFAENGVLLELKQVYELLQSLIRMNLKSFVEFINSQPSYDEIVFENPSPQMGLLVKYIMHAEENRKEHYHTLQDMILGSIISEVLSSGESSIDGITNTKFKDCQMFLDTNFIISVLDLRPPEFAGPAKELFNLLKKQKAKLKVFSFTVDEIVRVISGYLTDSARYPTSIRIDSIYSHLKRQRWTKSDAIEFIANIGSELENIGIKIEQKELDLNHYTPSDVECRSAIIKYKPDQSLFYQNHDLAAIETIRQLRHAPTRRLEDANAIFISSDAKLSKFNYIEMCHRENGTICEVILDKLLTNVIWLKDPASRPSFKSIIAAYSQNLFVDKNVWNRFYDVLSELRNKDRIESERISVLFYHNYIEGVLRTLDETQLDKITPLFVLETIEEASTLPSREVEAAIDLMRVELDSEFALKEETLKKELRQRENKLTKEIEELEKDLLSHLDAALSSLEESKNKELLRRLNDIKNNARSSARKRASVYVLSARIQIPILLAAGVIVQALTLQKGIFLTTSGIASIVLFFTGAFVSSRRDQWTLFEERLSNSLYARNMASLGLNEAEQLDKADKSPLNNAQVQDT